MHAKGFHQIYDDQPMKHITENDIELLAIQRLESLGNQYLYGSDITLTDLITLNDKDSQLFDTLKNTLL